MSMKEVAELQDGEFFVHSYDDCHIHVVLRQVCEGGGETGALDYVETQEYARREGDKIVLLYGRYPERCNPYAMVTPLNLAVREA